MVELGTCYGGETIVHRPIVEDWVHASGRVVVLGTAAHPTILGSGAMQGTAMGFEDGAALARLLARV